jgi:hypothetical protein
VVRHDGARDPEAVVDHAAQQIGRGGYCVIWNNCEHFAGWCKTGVRRSGQVRRSVVSALGTAIALMAIVLVFRRTPVGQRRSA